MPVGDYFQKYGPMHRRRHGAAVSGDDVQPAPRARQEPQPERPVRLARERAAEQPRVRLRRDEELERLLLRPLPRESEETTAPPRRRTMRRARRMPRYQVSPRQLVLSTVFIAVLIVLLLPYAMQLYYQGRAMPGVTVQGMAVADLEPQAIAAALEARHGDFLRQPLTVRYADQIWRPTLADLGVTFDMEGTMHDIMQAGRQGDPFSRLYDLWRLWWHNIDVAPRLIVDEQQLQHYLIALSEEINEPPKDAGLNVARDRIIQRPSVAGRQVLIEESANDMLLSLQTLAPQAVTLRTRALEPIVQDNSMQAAAHQAEELISSPLVLTHGERSWTWDQEKLAELLRIDRVGERLQVQIDHAALLQEVEHLAQSLDSGSVEPRLHFVDGTLQIVQEGRTGWRLQQAAAFQVISDTLRHNQPATRTVSLPVDELRPRIGPEKLAELGITQLIGQGQSSFAGSAEYRIINIKAGAARMDGVLIAPDEEFSFNTQLGEVNAENGFVEGYAVVGNRTKLEWGGGVCQDSTTVFRAAFWAGLPISERHAHPFYISWYDQFGLGPYGDGAGLDAAIYTGQDDLKFINDTGHWLLMQAQVDEFNQVLTIQLYGTNADNRHVELDGPYISNQISPPAEPVYIDDSSKPAGYFYQSDAARSGWDITINRIVFKNGVEVSREPFVTRFKAWPDVYVRGTGG